MLVPPEILCDIFQFFPSRELAPLRETCRKWCSIIENGSNSLPRTVISDPLIVYDTDAFLQTRKNPRNLRMDYFKRCMFDEVHVNLRRRRCYTEMVKLGHWYMDISSLAQECGGLIPAKHLYLSIFSARLPEDFLEAYVNSWLKKFIYPQEVTLKCYLPEDFLAFMKNPTLLDFPQTKAISMYLNPTHELTLGSSRDLIEFMFDPYVTPDRETFSCAISEASNVENFMDEFIKAFLSAPTPEKTFKNLTFYVHESTHVFWKHALEEKAKLLVEIPAYGPDIKAMGLFGVFRKDKWTLCVTCERGGSQEDGMKFWRLSIMKSG